MLKFLHIENIAVIEETDIDFTKGFNVLTGETGAGKSIVIDAINAVLGERTSKELIRAGCECATVSAVFGEIGKDNLKKLKELDVFPDEDGNILITRKLSATGKGIIKVNSKPVTATELREITFGLINIHGQHDNQALLNPETHYRFVDAIASNKELVDIYYDEFKNLNSIRKELSSLVTDEDEKERKTELLKYQIKEIEDADIKIGETAALKEKLKLAENIENTSKALKTVSNLISGDDEQDGAITKLKISLKELSQLNSEMLEKDYDSLNEALSLIEDANANIVAFLDNEEYSDVNIDVINQRLDLVHKLMLKYGNSEEGILAFLEDAKKQLDAITFSDKRYDELAEMLEASKQRLIEKGQALTKSRLTAAKQLEAQVCEVLKYLNMPNVVFKIARENGRYTKNGCDVIEFLISANSGESVKPLAKIASGGELSRTMLAIKSALLDKDSVDSMIFDEIDSGISGFAAEKVGNQLKRVSNARQVICVTHLAQIAAKADNHLLIEKTARDGKTFTKVNTLSGEDRVKEIARIMSGSEITESLYNSAKELLDRSLKNENL